MKNSTEIAYEAVELAKTWQDQANSMMNRAERKRYRQLNRLLTNPQDKVILARLIDQSFRSANPVRVADQIDSLFAGYGLPAFFSPLEKILINLFLATSRFFPGITVPLFVEQIRRNSSQAIVAGENQPFQAYLKKRKTEGVRVNVNFLGEAVLGEDEAKSRLEMNMHLLENPAVEYISVKVSTIFSQIQPLATEHAVTVLAERLSLLYRTAAAQRFECADGRRIPKFVNLDMENYDDLNITIQAFQRVLDKKEFKNCAAGIALQAYLPDSYPLQQEITAWARKRVAAGGSPVKIRIVKGANMEMEQLQAALYDWPQAPYHKKIETDANWKRMVTFGMRPENIQAVHLGIASHNLFDLAYAYLQGVENSVGGYYTFEMLEGMADHVRRTVQTTGQGVVVYAPVATSAQFINAVAYLIRRLDENTGKNNFLRYLSGLKTASGNWELLKKQFLISVKQMDRIEAEPHRTQNRQTESYPANTGTFYENQFLNESNTDWTRDANRKWAGTIRSRWKKDAGNQPEAIPVVVAGEELFANRDLKHQGDLSQNDSSIRIARFALATEFDINRAVEIARADPDGWRTKTHMERHRILSSVAGQLRRARGDLIGAAAANTGKLFSEADVEVSEAVDFAEYYPFAAKTLAAGLESIHISGKGVGVVISPWNFPIAIPCGGITAALAAGNTVIFKPSSDAVLVAWRLCQCFWRAGVSKKVLQFAPCSGKQAGSVLASHPQVDFAILTGGTQTGLAILQQRPDMLLAAETGGKNATVVTAMSDREQAIGNIIYSAFGNTGQKCSATSLLILEREVYHDETFKRQLADAARSIKTGSAWGFSNKMGPLIHPPSGCLKKALTRLEAGESWTLKPRNLEGNPHLWRPGIKWGVRPGSDTHLTEFFGPLLGVMCADNLDHALQLIHQTGYGLTAGLESLDRREQTYWQERVQAGNLYINRGTTGAVTLRQPFGGMGKSALGAGIKTGGPDYVAQFMQFEASGVPSTGRIQSANPILRQVQAWQSRLEDQNFKADLEDLQQTIQAVKSYVYQVERHFSRKRDYFHLRGQDNFLRYLPLGKVVVRLHAQDTLFETLARIAAVRVTGNNLSLSVPPGLENTVTRFLVGGAAAGLLRKDDRLVYEPDENLIKRIPEVDRIRYATPDRVPVAVYKAAAKTGFYIARARVLTEGRLELLHYYRQQSICHNYHRYGNLGDRTGEFNGG